MITLIDSNKKVVRTEVVHKKQKDAETKANNVFKTPRNNGFRP